MSEKTLFSKIIDREISADIEYEDDQCVAIHDVNPQAPTHLLIIPRKVIPRILQAEETDAPLLGHLLVVAAKIAKKNNLSSGFRVVVNSGKDAGETIPHLHVHLLAGRRLSWPPG